MPHYRKLVGSKCYLSPPCPEDAELWAAWENDLAVTIPLGDEAYTPSSLERARESIADIVKHGTHVFTVVDIATDEPIGRCLLFNIDTVNRSATLGIVIGEKTHWGQGYGTEATRLLLDYAFNLLNLNSVMLGVFAFNARAIASYRRVGFREIGRRRQARIIGGVRHDVVLMDILADEFESPYLSWLLEGA